VRRHVVRVLEVGNRARDAQDAMIAAGREIERVHRGVDDRASRVAETTVGQQPSARCVRVAGDAREARVAASLVRAAPLDATSDGRGRLTRAVTRQTRARHRLHRKMHVDPVRQRPGETAAVFRDLGLRADACAS